MQEQPRTKKNDGPHAQDSPAQRRCHCGNLLAKIVTSGIELKCRRCKRVEVIAFSDIEGWQQRTPSPV
jgi:phage FluMu protein Com